MQKCTGYIRDNRAEHGAKDSVKVVVPFEKEFKSQFLYPMGLEVTVTYTPPASPVTEQNEPSFEGVFAITWLLAIAYLVRRQRRK